MAYQKVKHMAGVFTSVFAHTGHITKEQAKGISGLAEKDFEKVYAMATFIDVLPGKPNPQRKRVFTCANGTSRPSGCCSF